ncbi:MAG: DNA polymerase IV [Acidimicrobiia bacterium]|nr:DNA polymerase IV [Acidimicrobiia bacterium]
MDCFYAAVHMRDEPELRGRPVVIGGPAEGRGVVAAASYEARAFGIRSAMPAARAKRLCPDAVFLRPDFNRYRSESQKIFSVFRQFTEVVQPVSIDEAYLDVSDVWRDWGSATALAKSLRSRVLDERNLTVSVGVGPNRLIAKIASDCDKPDGLTVVAPRRVQQFLDPMSARKLPGVGPVTEKKLAQKGFETIADLRRESLATLESLLGSYGRALHRYCRGIDERPVRVERERKSLSSENTFARDLISVEEARAEVDRLAESVAASLAKRELSAGTVTVKVRYSDFKTITRSQTLSLPTSDAGILRATARLLLNRTEAGRRPVRLLGVGCSNLGTISIEQLRLFGG